MKKAIKELQAYLEKMDLPEDQQGEIHDRIQVIEKKGHLLNFKFERTMTEKQAIICFLAKVSDDLNQKMEEIEGKNKALREAQQEAEKATQAKSDFLAKMSHEIRTPLNGLYGMLQLMEQSPLNPEQQMYMRVFKKSSEDLMYLINNILDFSKIEAEKLVLEHTDFSLKGTIEQTYQLFLPKAQEKGLFLHLYIDEYLTDQLRGDARRLRQILTNLIDNAIKFTSEGGISIRAKTIRKDSHSVHCQLSVSDTGIGIADNHLEKLFSPFTQADNSIAGRFGGTGLGLSISIELAKLMAGKLTLNTKSGEGSDFLLEIPLEIQEGLPSEISVAKEKQPAILMPNLAKKYPAQILIVEDNPINQLLLQVTLEKMGYQVQKTDSGYEALRRVKERYFDLIFMDMHMPELSGLETTRQILALPDTAHQPTIIGISANVTKKDKNACKTAGMKDFLPKPFELVRIQEVIQKWIPKKSIEKGTELSLPDSKKHSVPPK